MSSIPTSSVPPSHDAGYWRDEAVALLAFASMRGVGYWTLRKICFLRVPLAQLLRETGAEALNEALRGAGLRLGKDLPTWDIEDRRRLWQEGVALYKRLAGDGIELILHGHPQFPAQLRDIPDPPYWLFSQGQTGLLNSTCLAVVGTRKPSPDGLFLATYLGACLPHLSCVVVSGLAAGIDELVHRSALRFSVPTVAFLGSGLLADYPTGNAELRQEILARGGALITEYLPFQSYSAENFVRRNRLQSGISKAVVPVEWNLKSGTAHTVNFAVEHRRELICLRMPDWPDRSELAHARSVGATVFTVPGDETRLLTRLRDALLKDFPASDQMRLALDADGREESVRGG